MKKTIFYPIFIKCLAFINDPFWRFVYEDMAYGRCPYGLYLQKNYLCCSIKNKEFSYKIEPEKNPEEIYNETYSLLKQRVGLLSEKEKLAQREKAFRNRLTNKKDEWVSVKKKMIRDTLLENFVLQKSNNFDLSVNVAKKILSLLIIGLMFKTLNSKDIFYSNGFIQDINGFVFQPKKVFITKNIYSNKTLKSTEEDNSTIKLMNSYWPQYLSDMMAV
jgi:hypothetical protein